MPLHTEFYGGPGQVIGVAENRIRLVFQNCDLANELDLHNSWPDAWPWNIYRLPPLATLEILTAKECNKAWWCVETLPALGGMLSTLIELSEDSIIVEKEDTEAPIINDNEVEEKQKGWWIFKW